VSLELRCRDHLELGHLELKTHKKSSVDTSRRVVVTERCVVPPRHEANLAVKVMRVEVEKAEPVDWAVKPGEIGPGCVAPRTLLSNSTCVLARVLKYSHLQVVLEPDSYFSCAEPVVVTDSTRSGDSPDLSEPCSAGPTVLNRPCGSASESRPVEGCQGKVSSETRPVGKLPVVGSESESSPIEPRSGVDIGWLEQCAESSTGGRPVLPRCQPGAQPVPSMPAEFDRDRQTGTKSSAERYSTEGMDHTHLDRYQTGNQPVLPRCRTGTALSEIPVTGTPSASDHTRPIPSAGYSAESYRNSSAEPGLTVQLSRQCQLARVETTSAGDEGDDFQHVRCLIDRLPTDLSHDQQRRAEEFIMSRAHVFSRSEFDIGQTDILFHCIDTGDNRQHYERLRRHPTCQLPTIDEHVEQMLLHDVIEPAASPWCSNVVMVRKKDGTMRFCIDYPRTNELIRKDKFPLPKIDTCLDMLGGSRFFSSCDLRQGYWQTMLDEDDRDKTALVTRKGQWRFKVLSFGLCNAPSQSAKTMEWVLSGLSYEVCLIYLDDILVFSRTFAEHINHLAAVFSRLKQQGDRYCAHGPLQPVVVLRDDRHLLDNDAIASTSAGTPPDDRYRQDACGDAGTTSATDRYHRDARGDRYCDQGDADRYSPCTGWAPPPQKQQQCADRHSPGANRAPPTEQPEVTQGDRKRRRRRRGRRAFSPRPCRP